MAYLKIQNFSTVSTWDPYFLQCMFCMMRSSLSKEYSIRCHANFEVEFLYLFACCFVWVWNLVADIQGGKEAEGVWEYGVEENIWT